MPQLHCYIQIDLAEKLKKKADQAHLSVSKYLATLVRRDIQNDWPEDCFQLTSGWKGDALKRPEQNNLEHRDNLSIQCDQSQTLW